MLIRRDVDTVFRAFTDPSVTTKFWFTDGSGVLAEGNTVTWQWAMYGVSVPVEVVKLSTNRQIIVRWPGANAQHEVEWTFEPRASNGTFVTISETGFAGDDSSVLRQIADSTEGFVLVLAGCKAWLEHGIQLQLVQDRFPDGVGSDESPKA